MIAPGFDVNNKQYIIHNSLAITILLRLDGRTAGLGFTSLLPSSRR
jgi:hypothetical protein